MKLDTNLIKGNTKLLALSIISTGSKYGYEIIKILNEKFNGSFEIKEGSFYPILHSLEKDGFIKSTIYTMENKRIRKYYRITKKGIIYLNNKKEEWINFSTKVNQIIGIP